MPGPRKGVKVLPQIREDPGVILYLKPSAICRVFILQQTRVEPVSPLGPRPDLSNGVCMACLSAGKTLTSRNPFMCPA